MKVYVVTTCQMLVALLGLLINGGYCMRNNASEDRPHRHHKEMRAPMTVIYHKKAQLKPIPDVAQMSNSLVGHSHRTAVIHHAKAHHETRASREVRDVENMTHFLEEAEMQKQTKMPDFDDWLPKCVHHVKALVLDLDRSYTDQQLKYALRTDCILDKQFTVYEDGFHNKSACDKFAELLVIAREADLKYDTDEGYKGFCTDYYMHKSGKNVKKPEAEDEGGTAFSKMGKTKRRHKQLPVPWGLIAWVLALQTILAVGVWFGCQMRKGLIQ